VAIHPAPDVIEQNRSTDAIAHGVVNRSPSRGWQRDQGLLRSLAEYPKDPVAVLLAQVVYVGRTGLEHSQSEQSKQSDKGEVERIRRRARGDDHRLELQMGQAARRGLVRDGRAAYVRRRRCLEDSVDDTDAIKQVTTDSRRARSTA
jgi:hypothetical protein